MSDRVVGFGSIYGKYLKINTGKWKRNVCTLIPIFHRGLFFSVRHIPEFFFFFIFTVFCALFTVNKAQNPSSLLCLLKTSGLEHSHVRREKNPGFIPSRWQLLSKHY